MKGVIKMIEITFEKDKNRSVAFDNNTIIGECDFVIQKKYLEYSSYCC